MKFQLSETVAGYRNPRFVCCGFVGTAVDAAGITIVGEVRSRPALFDLAIGLGRYQEQVGFKIAREQLFQRSRDLFRILYGGANDEY